MVTSIAGQLGMAIENARLYGDLESTFLGTISALAAAVDAKDPYTAGHSNEVTTLSIALAEALGLESGEVQRIRIAATLHDIGKIGIDGTILLKPGRLTDAEREIINRHPAIGADILAPLDFLRDTVPLVLFHHERYGGGGYPSGICGEAIPFGARIISVADAFNAMVSDRPYREGLSLEAAMREIRDNSGTQFDPVCAEAFLKLLEDEAIASGRPSYPQRTGARTSRFSPSSESLDVPRQRRSAGRGRYVGGMAHCGRLPSTSDRLEKHLAVALEFGRPDAVDLQELLGGGGRPCAPCPRARRRRTPRRPARTSRPRSGDATRAVARRARPARRSPAPSLRASSFAGLLGLGARRGRTSEYDVLLTAQNRTGGLRSA